MTDFPLHVKLRARLMARAHLQHRLATSLATLLASAVASTRPHHGRFGHRSTAFHQLALARDVLSAPP